MIYFASDLHFGHKSILEWESDTRGHYESVEEMNADLIKQWNKTISNEDIVYYLGDFSFKKKQHEVVEILDQLNFKSAVFILGNHDHTPFRKTLEKYDNIEVKYADRIKAEGFIFYLSHFPMVLGERDRLICLHGHLHSTPSPNPNYQINVGYDKTKKIALSMEEVLFFSRQLEKQKRGREHL